MGRTDLVSKRYEVVVSVVALSVILQIVVIIFINILLVLRSGSLARSHPGGLSAACGSDQSRGQV